MEDEALSAVLRRVANDFVERKLEESFAVLVTLHGRLMAASGQAKSSSAAKRTAGITAGIWNDIRDELESAIRNLGAVPIAPHPGEPYDPLLHPAVGESPQTGTAGGNGYVVTRLESPGFRSVRGRVLAPARVGVERR